MNLEETLEHQLRTHLDSLQGPVFTAEPARRYGERRRAARTAVGLLMALTLVAGVVAATLGRTADVGNVRPTGLAPMDFGDGNRAFYDDGRQELHMGGEVLGISRVNELDLAAAATPWGAVYVTDEQEVRLLTEDASVRVLAEAPEDPAPFHSRVTFDAARPLAAWLTRDGDGVRLTLYRFGEDDGVVGTTTVPCSSEESCEWQQVAGIDSGRVFVRGPGGDTQVFDTDDLGAAPQRLPGYTVADVRNRVVLGEGDPPPAGVLGPDWRFAPAQGPESLLTFDGGHQVTWEPTLRSTDGGAPVRLDLPRDGVLFLGVDSDGSVLAAERDASSGVARYYDCVVPTGGCTPIGRAGSRRSGDPIFLGSDM